MKIRAILNPVSGNKNPQLVKKEVIEYFQKNNIQCEIVETQGSKDAHSLAQKAVEENIELLIVVGGDGTINEVINALANNNTCLGLVPNGTGNLLATSLGIPMDTIKALDIIFKGKEKKIDLGSINGQFFSIIAGCGFDAAIMENVKKEDKKLFGFLAYFIEGVKQAFMHKMSLFRMNIDGKRFRKRALAVLFINSGNILGNFITIVPNSSVTDGLLDVCIFSPQHTGEFIPVLWKILTKEDCDSSKQNCSINNEYHNVTHFKAKTIKLRCRPKLPVQADGDVIGYPPLDIESHPDALKVMVPEKVSTFVMNPEEFLKSLLDQAFQDIPRIEKL